MPIKTFSKTFQNEDFMPFYFFQIWKKSYQTTKCLQRKANVLFKMKILYLFIFFSNSKKITKPKNFFKENQACYFSIWVSIPVYPVASYKRNRPRPISTCSNVFQNKDFFKTNLKKYLTNNLSRNERFWMNCQILSQDVAELFNIYFILF